MVKDLGAEVFFGATNVAAESDVATLVARTEETYGRLDVAFSNAGVEGIMALTPDVTVAWLSSDAASFVTGHAMPFDGAFVAQ